MAKQKNLRYIGSTDTALYYERLGGFYIRNRPRKVKQTKATKKSAGKFGQASNLSGKLREALKPAIPNPTDRQMMYRFTDAIYHWLLQESGISSGEIIPLRKFCFNVATGITERWKIPIEVRQDSTGNIIVQLPAFVPANKIVAPAHTLAVESIITVAVVYPRYVELTNSSTLKINLPYTGAVVPARSVLMPVSAGSGAVVVVAARLQYLMPGGKYCSKAAFMPASVIDARFY